MDVITLGSFLYPIAADVTAFLLKQFKAFPIEEKYITPTYIKKYDLQQKFEENGYKLRGTSPKNIEQRKDEGWQFVYEIDNKNKKCYQLAVKNSIGQIDLIYMFKPEKNQTNEVKNSKISCFPIEKIFSPASNIWSKIKNFLTNFTGRNEKASNKKEI